MRRAVRSESGSATILVLWGLVILGALLTLASHGLKSVGRDARLAVATAQARALAEGVLRIVQARYGDGEWRLAVVAVGAGGWACRLPDASAAWIWIEDENGKLDLNKASDDQLARLFAALGGEIVDAATLAKAVVAFRNPPKDAAQRADDSRAYGREKRIEGPKYAPFETIFELDQVVGITPAVLRRALPHVTVHSTAPSIDLAAASSFLRHALAPLQSSRAGGSAAPTAGRSTVHVEVRGPDGAWSVREAVMAPGVSGRPAGILETRGGVRRAGLDEPLILSASDRC